MPVKFRVGDLVMGLEEPHLPLWAGKIVKIQPETAEGWAAVYHVQCDEDGLIRLFFYKRLECFQFAPVELEKERDDPNLVVKLAVHSNMNEDNFLRTIEMLRVSVLKEALEVIAEAHPSPMVTDCLVHHIEGILRGVEKDDAPGYGEVNDMLEAATEAMNPTSKWRRMK